MTELIDHKALAQSRLATQYTESDNLIAYIKTLLLEADTLEQVYQDLLEKRWIDTAEGVNLDIIGAIVGQSRIIIDGAVLEFFGFAGALGSGSFGDENDTSKGARFRDNGEPTTGNLRLSDPEYRIFIRARIIKNSTTTTADAIANHIIYLLGAPSAWVRDIAEATARVYVGKLLSNNETVFVKDAGLIPKPAGVRYEYVEYDGVNGAFGFQGTPDVKGFADESTPTDGGRFATEI